MDLVGDKWTLLIVRDLAAGPRRFVELQRVLPGISTEQLRSRLNRMVADGMLTRKRYREVPPRVDYELTERAYELLPILGALARWGYDWAWGSPREGESIDLGAIFRLAGGLFTSGATRTGTVEMTVTGAGEDGALFTSAVTITARGATVSEHEADSADAKIVGTESAWIGAFGPGQDRSELEVTGDEALATSLLDGLALTEVAHRAAQNAA